MIVGRGRSAEAMGAPCVPGDVLALVGQDGLEAGPGAAIMEVRQAVQHSPCKCCRQHIAFMCFAGWVHSDLQVSTTHTYVFVSSNLVESAAL